MAEVLNRRQFVGGSIGIAVGLGVLGPAALSSPAPAATARFFAHGVASGDPLPDAVVLWTRVTPTPSATPGSSLGPEVSVRWEISELADFSLIADSGSLTTGKASDHTVKVDATGLKPSTDYYFRFLSSQQESPIGRTRTAPALDEDISELRFGVVSCANWQAGYFTSYRHLAERGDLDAIIHLGDYLYEYQPGKYSMGHHNRDVRRHEPPREIVTLADYRERHGQYKTDGDLQALHAALPFIVTWDDHEVCDGNWAKGAFEHQPDEGSFAARRDAAQRAYDEWMPVRISGTAVIGDGTRMYRRLQFGTLADLSMLDLRTYRSERVDADDPAIDASDRTITGTRQLGWLEEHLSATPVRWKLIGNPVMVSPVLLPPRPEVEQYALSQTVSFTPLEPSAPNTDVWDGYTADRRRLLDHLVSEQIDDVVFLSGDVHTAWANDVPAENGVSVATEFVCSSITSNNVDDFIGVAPRTMSLSLEAAIQTENPHVRFVNLDDHGYCVLQVTRARAQMDRYAISDRADKDATTRLLSSWTVASGTPRVQPTTRPILA
ncbi:MAG: alkaline phosphatase D family protein [Aeromicrobium sp.]